MTREQIEKAAMFSCTSKDEVLTDFGRNCFIEGAQWRINAVWNDTTNIPKKGEHIVVVFRSGNLTSWNVSDDIVDVFKRFDVILWSYSKDLLPERKEGTK